MENSMDSSFNELRKSQKNLSIITHGKKSNKELKEIAERTELTEVIVANINRCKSHTEYHSYKKNIRLECGKKQYADIGENNPRSKLTEPEVLQIIELLKTTNLTAEQIGQRFGVSKSAINNINIRKNWKHLSQEFKCNIRKEYKNY